MVPPRKRLFNLSRTTTHRGGEMKLSERKFYDFIQESSDPSDVYTVTLTQNMEVTDANHWKVELLLERWRTRKQLVAYLRTVADMVEGL
jgi:hypothetical protein